VKGLSIVKEKGTEKAQKNSVRSERRGIRPGKTNTNFIFEEREGSGERKKVQAETPPAMGHILWCQQRSASPFQSFLISFSNHGLCHHTSLLVSVGQAHFLNAQWRYH
jgi:hypothetical protein